MSVENIYIFEKLNIFLNHFVIVKLQFRLTGFALTGSKVRIKSYPLLASSHYIGATATVTILFIMFVEKGRGINTFLESILFSQPWLFNYLVGRSCKYYCGR